MGCGPSLPDIPEGAAPLVPVPWPARVSDMWHWSDIQLLNALRFLVLRLDIKTAERNPRMQDRAEDLRRRAAAPGEPPEDRFKSGYVLVSSAAVSSAGLPENGVKVVHPDDAGPPLPPWWPLEHVLHIDRPGEELRVCVVLLQARVVSPRGCCPRGPGVAPSARSRPGAADALTARAEALVWHGRALLEHSKVHAAAAASLSRVSVGLLLPLSRPDTVKLIRLFADFDLLSKGYVTLRDLSRDVSSLLSARVPKSGMFQLVMTFSAPRQEGKLRYDEFVWTIHNLCVASDAELVQMAFAHLAMGEFDGEPCIALERFERDFPDFMKEDATPDDAALRRNVMGLRERRRAQLSYSQYSGYGCFMVLEDFVRVCKDEPAMLTSLREAREFFQRRTFGVRFWRRRAKALTKAIVRGTTVLGYHTPLPELAHSATTRARLRRTPRKQAKPLADAAENDPQATLPDAARLHPAVMARLPRLRPLVEAQSQLRDEAHALRRSRHQVAVLPADAPLVEQLRALKRVLPAGMLQQRKERAEAERLESQPRRGKPTSSAGPVLLTPVQRRQRPRPESHARAAAAAAGAAIGGDDGNAAASAGPAPNRRWGGGGVGSSGDVAAAPMVLDSAGSSPGGFSVSPAPTWAMQASSTGRPGSPGSPGAVAQDLPVRARRGGQRSPDRRAASPASTRHPLR